MHEKTPKPQKAESPIGVITSEFSNRIKGLLRLFTLKGIMLKLLISGAVMLVLWLTAMIWQYACAGDGKESPVVVRVISYLTYADGGASSNPFFIVCGALGKIFVMGSLLAVVLGGFKKLWRGIGVFGASTAGLRGMRAVSLYLSGVGTACVLYNLFTGMALLRLSMVGVAGILSMLWALGGGINFIRRMTVSLTASTASKTRYVDMPRAERVLSGMAAGFLMSIALSAIPWPYVPYMAGAACGVAAVVLWFVAPAGKSSASVAVVLAMALMPMAANAESWRLEYIGNETDYNSEYRRLNPEDRVMVNYGRQEVTTKDGKTGVFTCSNPPRVIRKGDVVTFDVSITGDLRPDMTINLCCRKPRSSDVEHLRVFTDEHSRPAGNMGPGQTQKQVSMTFDVDSIPDPHVSGDEWGLLFEQASVNYPQAERDEEIIIIFYTRFGTTKWIYRYIPNTDRQNQDNSIYSNLDYGNIVVYSDDSGGTSGGGEPAGDEGPEPERHGHENVGERHGDSEQPGAPGDYGDMSGGDLAGAIAGSLIAGVIGLMGAAGATAAGATAAGAAAAGGVTPSPGSDTEGDGPDGDGPDGNGPDGGEPDDGVDIVGVDPGDTGEVQVEPEDDNPYSNEIFDIFGESSEGVAEDTPEIPEGGADEPLPEVQEGFDEGELPVEGYEEDVPVEGYEEPAEEVIPEEEPAESYEGEEPAEEVVAEDERAESYEGEEPAEEVIAEDEPAEGEPDDGGLFNVDGFEPETETVPGAFDSSELEGTFDGHEEIPEGYETESAESYEGEESVENYEGEEPIDNQEGIQPEEEITEGEEPAEEFISEGEEPAEEVVPEDEPTEGYEGEEPAEEVIAEDEPAEGEPDDGGLFNVDGFEPETETGPGAFDSSELEGTFDGHEEIPEGYETESAESYEGEESVENYEGEEPIDNQEGIQPEEEITEGEEPAEEFISEGEEPAEEVIAEEEPAEGEPDDGGLFNVDGFEPETETVPGAFENSELEGTFDGHEEIPEGYETESAESYEGEESVENYEGEEPIDNQEGIQPEEEITEGKEPGEEISPEGEEPAEEVVAEDEPAEGEPDDGGLFNVDGFEPETETAPGAFDSSELEGTFDGHEEIPEGYETESAESYEGDEPTEAYQGDEPAEGYEGEEAIDNQEGIQPEEEITEGKEPGEEISPEGEEPAEEVIPEEEPAENYEGEEPIITADDEIEVVGYEGEDIDGNVDVTTESESDGGIFDVDTDNGDTPVGEYSDDDELIPVSEEDAGNAALADDQEIEVVGVEADNGTTAYDRPSDQYIQRDEEGSLIYTNPITEEVENLGPDANEEELREQVERVLRNRKYYEHIEEQRLRYLDPSMGENE